MFDLTQVRAIAHVLDDIVLATLEHDQALVAETDDIARAIDKLRISLVQRILDEGSSRLLRIIVITHRQRRASNAELTLHTRRYNSTVVIVEDEDVRIATGIADGQGLRVGYLLINNIIGAVEGNLNRTIEVGEGHMGQVAMPVVVLLRGEHLASEPHRTEALEPEGREQVHVGDVHHNRGHPEEEVHLMLLEHLEDLRREGCQMGREHDERAGLGHQHAEFETIDIEHDRRERPHHEVIAEVERIDSPVDEVEETLMVEYHTLWRACRT